MAGEPTSDSVTSSGFFTPTVILAFLICVILITIIVYFYRSDSGLLAKVEKLEKTNESLQTQVVMLNNEITKMKTSYTAMEKAIKEMKVVYRDRHLDNEERTEIIHELFTQVGAKGDLLQQLVPHQTSRNNGRGGSKRTGSGQQTRRRTTVRTPMSDEEEDDMSDSELYESSTKKSKQNLMDL